MAKSAAHSQMSRYERRPEGLEAYGDFDDHLRLVVLLAEEATKRERAHTAEAQKVCTSPGSSWAERVDAAGEILAALRGERVVFANPDALYCSEVRGEERWNDVHFRRERNQLFGLLLNAACSGVEVDFVRYEHDPLVTRELEQAGVTVRGAKVSDDPVTTLSPQMRPIADWLIRANKLAARELHDHVTWYGEHADSREADAWVVSTAYDCLPPSVGRDARRLSTVRVPQAVNGAIGQFGWAGDLDSHTSIRPESVEQLVECGFLQANSDQSEVSIPRLVRQFLHDLAVAFGEAEELHAYLRDTKLPLEATLAHAAHADSATPRIEAHRHAVLSGDATAALETADFYVNDVRSIAYQMSIAGKFAEAAKLYRSIVDVDNADAYAWEYLGYNLARAAHPNADAIDDALTEACKLEPGNPLYHGRLLGYRVERGEDIERDFRRSFVRYETLSSEALAYFAVAVFKGYERAGKRDELKALIKSWQTRLRQARDERVNDFIRMAVA